MKVAAPSYFYPDKTKWNRLIAIKPAFVIINPSSGPGYEPDPAYTELVARLVAAGIRVLGYVACTWANKPIYESYNEMEAYKAFYGRTLVTGTFLDESPTERYKLFYCQALLRGQELLVLNPGTFPDPAYAKLPVTSMIYETDYDIYMEIEPPAWVLAEPNPLRFWHCVYAVEKKNLAALVATARRRNAGFLWATDDVLPNQYDSIPPWLEELAKLVAS